MSAKVRRKRLKNEINRDFYRPPKFDHFLQFVHLVFLLFLTHSACLFRKSSQTDYDPSFSFFWPTVDGRFSFWLAKCQEWLPFIHTSQACSEYFRPLARPPCAALRKLTPVKRPLAIFLSFQANILSFDYRRQNVYGCVHEFKYILCYWPPCLVACMHFVFFGAMTMLPWQRNRWALAHQFKIRQRCAQELDFINYKHLDIASTKVFLLICYHSERIKSSSWQWNHFCLLRSNIARWGSPVFNKI